MNHQWCLLIITSSFWLMVTLKPSRRFWTWRWVGLTNCVNKWDLYYSYIHRWLGLWWRRAVNHMVMSKCNCLGHLLSLCPWLRVFMLPITRCPVWTVRQRALYHFQLPIVLPTFPLHLFVCRVWSAVNRAACWSFLGRGYLLHRPAPTEARLSPSVPPRLSRSPLASANWRNSSRKDCEQMKKAGGKDHTPLNFMFLSWGFTAFS